MFQPTRKRLVLSLLIVLGLSSCAGAASQKDEVSPTTASSASQDWMEDFDLPARKLASVGESKYFNLTPGYELVLASESSKLTITVLNETKEINGITTRVIEENEEVNGAQSEISRNFYAMDQETGDVFYFGEEVDFFSNGQVTGHGGAWLAYENGNRPGMIMPGDPRVGMQYYQELAPGVAADRARVVSVSEIITTKAGSFDKCLLTQESSKIEVGAIEYKTYCPGVGLVQDQSLTLVSYQTVKTTAP